MTFVTKLLLCMFLLSVAALILSGFFSNDQGNSLTPLAGFSFWALIIKLLIDRPTSVRID